MHATPIYSTEQIQAWALSALPTTSKSFDKPIARKRKSEDFGDRANFDAICAGCTWAASCATNTRMDEPTWYGFASLIGHCENGEELFHEISALDPRYDEEETAEKLKHALADANPRTCENIREALGHAGCRTCVFSGKIHSPMRLGYQPTEVVALMSKHVLETHTGQFLDLETGMFSTRQAFNDLYIHITKPATPHNCLAKNELTRKVQGTIYLPGSHDLFVRLETGQEAVNVWKPSDLVPTEGDCTPILLHLQNMMPDDEVRLHLLNVLAYLVQHPGQKVPHAFVLTGKQGTGKSLLFELVQKLFGADNCRFIEGSGLGARFNAHFTDVQVVGLEELWTQQRVEIYNAIKTLITARTMRVEEKHLPSFDARTPDFILATSNHHMPITLESDDRRFLIYRSPMEPQDSAYYDTLSQCIERDAGAFLKFLIDRDISSFNPKKAPPLTEAKTEIIRASRSSVTQEVEALIEESSPVFWRDIITVSDVRDELAKRVGRTPSPNEVTAALRTIGSVRMPVVRLGERTLRLWAWTNTDHWLQASPEEIRSHLRQLHPR